MSMSATPRTKRSGGEFLTDLVDRGLGGVRLVISDAHAGLIKAIARCFQVAAWQQDRVHAMRKHTHEAPPLTTKHR